MPAYFDSLWKRPGDGLMPEQMESWDDKVTRYQLQGGSFVNAVGLEDIGADADRSKLPPIEVPHAIADTTQLFVKSQGSSRDRLPTSEAALKVIESSGCHWAVCYPDKKPPKSVEDNAIIFIGMFTRDPSPQAHQT